MKKHTLRYGLSMLEVLAVIVIISILTVSSFFVLSRMGTHIKASGAAVEISQTCALARQRATEKNVAQFVVFYLNESPQRWALAEQDSLGNITDLQSSPISPSIKFGRQDGIVGNGPNGAAIPSDGVTFTNDRISFLPRRGVAQSGVVYVTDGRETYAVFVNPVGNAIVRRYGNNSWN